MRKMGRRAHKIAPFWIVFCKPDLIQVHTNSRVPRMILKVSPESHQNILKLLYNFLLCSFVIILLLIHHCFVEHTRFTHRASLIRKAGSIINTKLAVRCSIRLLKWAAEHDSAARLR